MATIKEAYQEAIEKEDTYTAHKLHYLLSKRLVKLNDDVENIDYSLIDWKAVDKLIKQNYLGFQFIKLYSLKLDKYLWIFVFAKDENEALHFTKTQLRKNPINCIEYMMDVEVERGREILSFREMKKEYSEYPALCAYYETDEVYR